MIRWMILKTTLVLFDVKKFKCIAIANRIKNNVKRLVKMWLLEKESNLTS